MNNSQIIHGHGLLIRDYNELREGPYVHSQGFLSKPSIDSSSYLSPQTQRSKSFQGFGGLGFRVDPLSVWML